MRWSSRGSPASRPIRNNPRRLTVVCARFGHYGATYTEADLVDDSERRPLPFSFPEEARWQRQTPARQGDRRRSP